MDELDAETVEEIMIKHEASGIHILAAPQRPEQADKISVAAIHRRSWSSCAACMRTWWWIRRHT